MFDESQRLKAQFSELDVQSLLSYLGDDPSREGLNETPTRFLKALKHWFSGYGKNPAEVLKVFQDGADGYNQMVFQRDIPVWSHCEHHIAPFFGVCHVGYIPNKRIVGLSKLSRVVEIFSRRLQVQERITKQVADALEEHLQPLGVGVVLECRHTCMESRGIEKAGAITVTSALRGVFHDEASARAEFLDFVKSGRNVRV